MDIKELTAIVIPPSEVQANLDFSWSSLSINFPNDYKQLATVYGGGQFYEELSIASPDWIIDDAYSARAAVAFLRDVSAKRPSYVNLAIQAGANAIDDEPLLLERAYGRETDQYIWLGYGASGQNLFWRTVSDESNDWPLIATDGSGIDYAPDGLVSYLVALFDDEFDSEVFDDEWLSEVRAGALIPFSRIAYRPDEAQ